MKGLRTADSHLGNSLSQNAKARRVTAGPSDHSIFIIPVRGKFSAKLEVALCAQGRAYALPGQLGSNGVVSGFERAGAEGEGVSVEGVEAAFVAAAPERKEAGFDVVGDGISLDGEAPGVGDVAAVAARARSGSDALDDSLA